MTQIDTDLIKTAHRSFRTWFSESVLVKLCLIGILVLLLLIPSSWIESLIVERQARQEDVIKEIANNWSGSQLVEGPVMVLPYKKLVTVKDTAGHTSYKGVLTSINILPEILTMSSSVTPQVLHRGDL